MIQVIYRCLLTMINKKIHKNKHSHKMIKVKHKYLLTMINKEKDKSKHSHEMTRFCNWITVWSLLHELVVIYGSSHGSIFESPKHRVQNGYKSESPVTEFGSPERVWNVVIHIHTHKYLYIHIHVLIHTPGTHMHTSIHIHTIYLHIY